MHAQESSIGDRKRSAPQAREFDNGEFKDVSRSLPNLRNFVLAPIACGIAMLIVLCQ